MGMTNYLGVRDPGRAGGSWIIYLCNTHPAGMRLVGEAHRPEQLDFAADGEPWPGISTARYDEKVIAFMESQEAQGVACAGVVKCFWDKGRRFILDHGGRIFALVRNPMLVVGVNRHKNKNAAHYLGHEPTNEEESFRAILLYYRDIYLGLWQRRFEEPITRIEDYNRSCARDGRFLKEVMEWATQTPWDGDYICTIQANCFPGYSYPLRAEKDGKTIVKLGSAPTVRERWRMNWCDDPRPQAYWEAWSSAERQAFAEIMGEVCDLFGYDYRQQPGFVQPSWELENAYSWSGAGLEPVPYSGGVEW